MTLSLANACARLSALGLRQRQVHGIIDEVQKWKRCNGTEGAIKRLKALKVDYIQTMAGNSKVSSWIAYHADGTPKGPFRALWRNRTFKGRTKALNALMIYSANVSTTVTLSQWRKFQRSVEEPIPGDSSFITSAPFRKVTSLPKAAALDDWVPNDTWAPIGRKSVPDRDIEQWFPSSIDDGTVRKAFSRFPEVFAALHRDAKPFLSKMPKWGNPSVIGKIGFIQEPGFKLRAVANPNRVHQLALKPLKEALLLKCRTIKRDCTHDQEKGVRKIQEWLQQGLVCHSIDLSDATNNFPLDLQMRIARMIMDPSWEPWLSHFEYCSTQPWLVNDPEQGWRKISWAKGQPLGLGPSFPMFALSHHVVANGACKGPSGGDYVILGDDIVIQGDGARDLYLRVLQRLGCPVAAEKTVTSSCVAEFAGKVITPEAVYAPFKWKAVSDRSFLDVAKNIGPAATKILRPRQLEVVDLLAEIPEDLGGLGWNPLGLSYADRVERNLETIRALDSSAAYPITRVNSGVVRLRLRSLPFRNDPNVWDTIGGRGRETRPESREVDVGSRIRTVCQPLREVLPENEQMPTGYSPEGAVSDPRGRTRLEQVETRARHLLAKRKKLRNRNLD